MGEVAFVCVETTVTTVGSRLTDGDDKPIPETGSYVAFASGWGLVAYSTPKVLELERPGDKVQVCLIAVPKGCPKGDDRTLSTGVAARRGGGRMFPCRLQPNRHKSENADPRSREDRRSNFSGPGWI